MVRDEPDRYGPEQVRDLGWAIVEAEMLRLHVCRRLSDRLDGISHGPEGSVDKLLMTAGRAGGRPRRARRRRRRPRRRRRHVAEGVPLQPGPERHGRHVADPAQPRRHPHPGAAHVMNDVRPSRRDRRSRPTARSGSIRLNRPEQLNATNHELHAGLAAAVPPARRRPRRPGGRHHRQRAGVLGRRRLRLHRRADQGRRAAARVADPRPADRDRHGGVPRAGRRRRQRAGRRARLQHRGPVRHRLHGRERPPRRPPRDGRPGGRRRRAGHVAAAHQPAAGQGVRADRRQDPGAPGGPDRPGQPRVPRRRGASTRPWPAPGASPSCPSGPPRTPSASSTCTSSGRCWPRWTSRSPPRTGRSPRPSCGPTSTGCCPARPETEEGAPPVDFELDDEQLELQRVVRDIVERECPPALVRAVVDGSDDGRGLWKTFVELDWPSLTVPADDGGMGMTAVELVITLEELGRVADPTPFLATTSQYVPVVRECAERRAAHRVCSAPCAPAARARPPSPPTPCGPGATATAGCSTARRPTSSTATGPTRSRSSPPPTRAWACSSCRRARLAPPGRPRSTGRSTSPRWRVDGVRVAADRAFTGPGVEDGVDARPARGGRRARRRDGRRVPAGARARAGPRQGAEAVRRADRLVPGGEAHGRRHVRRHRAGPGAVPLRRPHPPPRTTRPGPGRLDGQGGRGRLPAPGGASTASSCSAGWASPGRTTCRSTCGGPRSASPCSARPPRTGPGRPGTVLAGARRRRRRRDAAQLRRADRGVPRRVRGVARREHARRGDGAGRAVTLDRPPPGVGARRGSGSCSTPAGWCPGTRPSTAAATRRCSRCSSTRRSWGGATSTRATTRRGCRSSPRRCWCSAPRSRSGGGPCRCSAATSPPRWA